MWRLVVTVVLWHTITSQPIEPDTENARSTRQLDFVHCCPCPSPDSSVAASAPRGDLVDDCPCKLRDADAQGSSSVFLPRAMRPARPFVNPSEISKEDQKPLLRPEVGLASSMLETLREVTDEEYQEAVAREAARNAARASELGNHSGSENKAITIIVDTREKEADGVDNITPEASETQESRCIVPLETPQLGQVRESQKLFKLRQNLRNKNEMDTGPSSIQEKIVSLNKGLEELKLKAAPSLLSLFPKKNPNDGNIQNLLKPKNTPLPKETKEKVDKSTNILKPQLPTLSIARINLKNKNDNPHKPLTLATKTIQLPNFRINLQKKTDDNNNMDNGVLSSNNQEKTVNPSNANPSNNPVRFSLEKLLNLKDVELLPPKHNKPLVSLPILPLFPQLKINTPRKDSKLNKDCKLNEDKMKAGERSHKFQTDILDTLPHASENKPVLFTNDMKITTDHTNKPVEDLRENTRILDTLPSASESKNIVADSDANKSFTNTNTIHTNKYVYSEQQSLNGLTNPSTHKLSKDDLENADFDDDDVEIIIDADENTDIEAIELIEELDQPDEDFEVEGTEIDENGHQFNLNFQEEALEADFSDDESNVTDNENSNFEDSNLDQTEEVQSTDELFRHDVLQRADSKEDGETKSTNNNFVTIIRNTDENTDANASQLAEVISESFKNTQQSQNSFEEDNIYSNDEENDPENNNRTVEQTSSNLSIDDVPSNNAHFRVSNEDLQKMSDSLLGEQQNRNSNIQSTNNYLKPLLTQEISGEIASDSDSSATTLMESVKKANRNSDMSENGNALNTKNRVEDSDTQNFNTECPSTLKTNDALNIEEKKEADPATNVSEMASGASESIFKTARAPFLQQSIVVQPTTLFDPSNLIPQVPPLDIPNLNLPTLEDLTSGLSSLLGGGARASKNEGVSSEFVSAEDCSDTVRGMDTGASTTKTKSALPSLRPLRLEDVNLNIFQMNPLSGGLSSKTPSINLNSFKTRLPVPKKLELKPLLLESSLGKKNGGLLGATLSFGEPSQKLSSLRNEKPFGELGSIFDRPGSDILGSSLPNVPSLEELHNKMRMNAHSILKSSPLINTLSNPLEDTLRSSQALGNSLKSHTSNTLRNLEQTLTASLDGARLSSTGNAGTKFAKPQDLLEMVSSAHEDMNDKLYAIHVDLQDRLSSLHDRFADQAKIQPLQLPSLNRPQVEERETGTWKIASAKKKSSSNLKNSRNTSTAKKIASKKTTTRPNKASFKIKEESKVRPLKISEAASSLNPKLVEVPKLRTTSSKPPFSTPLQRDENLKLRETGPLFANPRPKHIQRNQYKPLGDFKVSIEPTLPPNFRARPHSERPARLRESPTVMKSKYCSDPSGFASESKAIRIPASVLVESKSSEFNTDEFPIFTKSSSVHNSKTSPDSTLKSKTPLQVSPVKPTPIALPKLKESPLLSKMRESIRIRLSQPKHSQKLQQMGSLAKPLKKDDMSRSASENKQVVVSAEPMKENVSYKCKMVCVRE